MHEANNCISLSLKCMCSKRKTKDKTFELVAPKKEKKLRKHPSRFYFAFQIRIEHGGQQEAVTVAELGK